MSKETTRRPVRTALQAGPAFIIVECIDVFITDLDERQYGALVALLVFVLSTVQNYVESRKGSDLL